MYKLVFVFSDDFLRILECEQRSLGIRKLLSSLKSGHKGLIAGEKLFIFVIGFKYVPHLNTYLVQTKGEKINKEKLGPVLQ